MATYRYDSFHRIVFWCASVMFSGGALIPDSWFNEENDRSIFYLRSIFFLFAFLSLYLAVKVSASISITDKGIEFRSLWNRRRFVEWSGIERLRFNGTMNRIEVFDERQKRVGYVENQLAGYESIVDLLRTRKPSLFDPSATEVFHTNWQGITGFSVLGLVILTGAGIAIWKGIYASAVILLVLAIGPVWMVLYSIYSVSFEETEIIIKSFLKTIRVDAKDILLIEFGQEAGEQGIKYNVVRIRLKDKKEIKLSGFREGDELLFEKLQWFFRTARKKRR